MPEPVHRRAVPLSARLPVALQTSIVAVRERAAASGLPVADLAIGSPVDPVPDVVQRALPREADAHAYAVTAGRLPLREAVLGWLERCHGVTGLDAAQVLPVIGSKELIGSLALHLQVGPGDVVVQPRLAYPTYSVGARAAGAELVEADTVAELEALPRPPALVWVNSPSNPTGRTLGAAALRELVEWCRAHGALLVADECYLDLGWDVEPVSVLHPDVCGATHEGVLAVHSLSKRSSLAGYRVGFVSGDADVVAELLSVRRNLGLTLPAPQQGVAVAALEDDEHVAVQRGRYAARRDALRTALLAAGFRIEHSEAGLYLWATRDEPGAATVDWLADLGIVAVDGLTYGRDGVNHVRLALTAPDQAVEQAAQRLTAAAATVEATA